ncbi:hypothetical protein TrVE_jg1807 [Triparma verrucosa]|uniref:C2 domain-containing protein n=1 Tax=Triparma verrucosa TaxID=1606542 RepID=A0A9W7C4N5_9STRA|nr:hypothetical protein TrVE_jg1807 [Triparma verrucosa]
MDDQNSAGARSPPAPPASTVSEESDHSESLAESKDTPIGRHMLESPHCPHHHLKMRMNVYIASVNMGNALPSQADLEELLPDDGGGLYDIIVLGAQEATFSVVADEDGEDETSTRISTANGKTDAASAQGSYHRSSTSANANKDRRSTASRKSSLALPTKLISDVTSTISSGLNAAASTVRSSMATDNTSLNIKNAPKKEKWGSNTTPRRMSNVANTLTHAIPDSSFSSANDTKVLHARISKRLPSFTPVVRYQRGEMRLHIYIRNSLCPAVSDVEVAAENTGLAHLLANKGGIVARITLGETSLSFLSCHLQAHEGKEHYHRRCADLKEILRGTKCGGHKRYDVSILSHHMFVLGDLNFRVDLPKEKVVELLKTKNYAEVYGGDELANGVAMGDCLSNFNLADCSSFAPTFKVKRHVVGSIEDGKSIDEVYNLQRTPSYCDRILWHSLDGLEEDVSNTSFFPVTKYAASDHNPVAGTFTVDVIENVNQKCHIPSAILPRRETLLETDSNTKKQFDHDHNVDSSQIIKHNETFLEDFNLDDAETVGEKKKHQDKEADPELDGDSDEDSKEADSDEDSDEGKVCHLIFSHMRATNLTEMDSQLAGGGSDPYVSFVPLTEHLLTHKHMKHVTKLPPGHTAASYFYKFPKTKTIRHNCNPKWDDVIDLELNVKNKHELRHNKFIALTLMDHDDYSEDDVIGTVVLNLCAFVHPDHGQKQGHTQRGDKEVMVKSNNSDSSGASNIGNIISGIFKSSASFNDSGNALSLSRPVIKNGMVQGHFECEAEIVWVDVDYYGAGGARSSISGMNGGIARGGCCAIS